MTPAEHWSAPHLDLFVRGDSAENDLGEALLWEQPTADSTNHTVLLDQGQAVVFPATKTNKAKKINKIQNWYFFYVLQIYFFIFFVQIFFLVFLQIFFSSSFYKYFFSPVLLTNILFYFFTKYFQFFLFLFFTNIFFLQHQANDGATGLTGRRRAAWCTP